MKTVVYLRPYLRWAIGFAAEAHPFFEIVSVLATVI